MQLTLFRDLPLSCLLPSLVPSSEAVSWLGLRRRVAAKAPGARGLEPVRLALFMSGLLAPGMLAGKPSAVLLPKFTATLLATALKPAVVCGVGPRIKRPINVNLRAAVHQESNFHFTPGQRRCNYA